MMTGLYGFENINNLFLPESEIFLDVFTAPTALFKAA